MIFILCFETFSKLCIVFVSVDEPFASLTRFVSSFGDVGKT